LLIDNSYDQPIADYLWDNQVLHLDMNLVHADDYKSFNRSLEDYMKRYHVGHYSSAGNHFFVHSIKHPVVEWLSPKPTTYRNDEDTMTDFLSYVPNAQ
jgi:hypothetical protein